MAALFLGAAVLGIVSGVLFAYAGDLPRISALDDYAPSTITRVHGGGGEVVGEFAIQRREVIGYDDISPNLRYAILAAEDARFFQHFGLSIPRIIITLAKDIMERRKAAGASTLTQQLTRKLFLTDEKTWERKIKEALLAIQIEKRYTKREIFTMYCNQMYFGHGAYGVEAAARLFFDKPASQLDVPEAALIAGVLQGNVRQSPYVNMEAALRRRDYALGRMADEGYITAEEADAYRRSPIVTRGQPTQDQSVAPYFIEEVRKHLETAYGAKRLYEHGLAVRTTLDVQLQEAANAALDAGLRRLDKLRGYRQPVRNVVSEGQDVEAFRHPRWSRPIGVGDIVPAVAIAADGAMLAVRVGRYRGTIDRAGYAWTRRTSAADLARPGDLLELRVTQLDEAAGTLTGAIEQPSEVEGAVLVIENRTGYIRAMVGGFSFERSKFNRATQALRQVGSAFKPIVYGAAIDRGFTPATIIHDSPATFSTGPGQPGYSPSNYDRKFEGPITLRRALEQSRNVPAVRVMDQLGPDQVVAYARRLGVESPMPAYLSVALGAAEATLLEITSAYSVFPNQGVRMRPFAILTVADREGNVLEENRPEPRDAIRADTAFVMTNLLRGVVQRGTAARAAALNWPLGGKTGTTDDYSDAWFIGFDPDITVGVWVGHDVKRPLGPGQSGSVAALPIWIDVMKAYIERGRDGDHRPEFAAPENIVFVTVDRTTGSASPGGVPGAITEAFISGTQPGSGFPRP
jgi:penicillin-binding protein 1A